MESTSVSCLARELIGFIGCQPRKTVALHKVAGRASARKSISIRSCLLWFIAVGLDMVSRLPDLRQIIRDLSTLPEFGTGPPGHLQPYGHLGRNPCMLRVLRKTDGDSGDFARIA